MTYCPCAGTDTVAVFGGGFCSPCTGQPGENRLPIQSPSSLRKHYAIAKTGSGHCPDARKSVKKRGVAHHTGTDRSVVVDIFDSKTLTWRAAQLSQRRSNLAATSVAGAEDAEYCQFVMKSTNKTTICQARLGTNTRNIQRNEMRCVLCRSLRNLWWRVVRSAQSSHRRACTRGGGGDSRGKWCRCACTAHWAFERRRYLRCGGGPLDKRDSQVSECIALWIFLLVR